MTAASLSETLNELNSLCQFFADAEKRLQKGEVVNMNGIDARVAAVCQTVQKALPDQQKEFLPELTVLINLLDSYEKAIKDAQSARQD